MILSALVFLAAGSADPQAALDAALRDAEPAPALRAAFRATISSAGAVRQIEYDPLQEPSKRFSLVTQYGEDTELDSIVSDWAHEAQPDVRLFADDLRSSLGAGWIQPDAAGWRVTFQHRLSSNDGPLDAMVSQRMEGGLKLDPETGALAQLEYRIREPFRTPDGAWVNDYRQVYTFGRSQRWGVTFVTGYELSASGGRLGISGSRTFAVRVTDVAFTLAGDARQELTSKPQSTEIAAPLLYAGADLR